MYFTFGGIMFKTELLNLLETNPKIAKSSNSYLSDLYRVGYDSKLKKLISIDELYHQIETMFRGVDNYDFRYLRIDNLPYHIIEYKVEDKFVAIRRQSIYYLNKANNGYERFIWKNTSDNHLIYFDTLSCVVSRKQRYLPIMFHSDIDFVDSYCSLILNMLVFRPLRDLKREAEQSPNIYEKSFSYNDVLSSGVQNGRDFVDIKWKRISKIYPYINKRKLTFIELLLLRRLQPKLTEHEFIKVVQWYMRNKLVSRPNIQNSEHLYELYLNDVTHSNTKDYTSDIFRLAKGTRTRIEMTAKTLKGVKRYHDTLVEKLNRKNERKLIKELKIKYDINEIWMNIDKNLRESNLDITILNSPGLLKQEGINMNHCVGGYIEHVRRGISYIFHINYNDKPYTCELKMTTKGKPIINQLYGTYNSEAPSSLRKEIMKIIGGKNGQKTTTH